MDQLGCCTDKKYGKGCTDSTCMRLPAGSTCGHCIHIRRCLGMGYTDSPQRDCCDFFPRKFRPSDDTSGGYGEGQL